jgi:hypothetical protein
MLLILVRLRPEEQVPDSRWMVTAEAVVNPVLQNGHCILLPMWVLECWCWEVVRLRYWEANGWTYLHQVVHVHEHPLTWAAIGMAGCTGAVLV